MQDVCMGKGGVEQSLDTRCKTPALELSPPKPRYAALTASTLKIQPSSFCTATQGRSLPTLALALNPPGSSGLSLPDKLRARMRSLGAAPNPQPRSLLLAHRSL